MLDVPPSASISRRRLIGGSAAVAAAGLFAGALAAPSAAMAATDGYGLRIVDRNENGGRLQYYRFATDAIEWDPGVNVLLPDGYHTSGKRYPVLYLLHGGNADFRTFHLQDNIIGLTAGREVIVVMPDASTGWYCNPVNSFVGPRNWETFHIAQLLPWIDANFRTFAEYNGRAVAGFSMGGFGALKYAAKYYGHFCSVSSHSGPASLRRDFGLVVHWANATSAALDLGGGTVYGSRCGTRRGSAPTTRSSASRVSRTSGSSWRPARHPTRSTGSTPSTKPRCSPVSASSARHSPAPASRTSGARCPAGTSSATTCSSRTSTGCSDGYAAQAEVASGGSLWTRRRGHRPAR